MCFELCELLLPLVVAHDTFFFRNAILESCLSLHMVPPSFDSLSFSLSNQNSMTIANLSRLPII
jgi:hypothetical protein